MRYDRPASLDATTSQPRAASALIATCCSAFALLVSACAAAPSPTDANPRAARLAECVDGPHCVSSTSSNPDRYTRPIPYTGTREAAHERLIAILRRMPRNQIVSDDGDRIRATFTSAVFGFVDDVECAFSTDRMVIEVRSSSRIGYYDFGVNHGRVETIRRMFLDVRS